MGRVIDLVAGAEKKAERKEGILESAVPMTSEQIERFRKLFDGSEPACVTVARTKTDYSDNTDKLNFHKLIVFFKIPYYKAAGILLDNALEAEDDWLISFAGSSTYDTYEARREHFMQEWTNNTYAFDCKVCKAYVKGYQCLTCPMEQDRIREAERIGNADDVMIDDGTWQAAETEENGLTEDGVALAFVYRHKSDLRYDTTGKTWFHWSGSRWEEDRTKKAFDYARKICRAYSDEKPSLATAKSIKAVEVLASSDQRIAVTPDIWDADDYLLGTPNGTVDLRTGIMRPARPEDYITKLTACSPADTVNAPVFLKFLDQVTQDDKEMQRFLQQYLGSCLTGDTRDEAFIFIYGEGQNGKSKLQGAIKGILNDYARTATAEAFTTTKGDRHTTDLAMLHNARVVVASETKKGKAWDEVRIKSVTGGDEISCRFMHKDNFTYKPKFKLFYVGNFKPNITAVDLAMRRRILIVPFTLKLEEKDKDYELANKLRREYPGILRWLIDGCLDWQRNGLVRPAAVLEATEQYFSDQDVIAAFLEEECELGAGLWCKRSDAFRRWADFAKGGGFPPGSTATLTEQLDQREGIRSTNSHKVRNASGEIVGTYRAFVGLALKGGMSVAEAPGDAF